uniref:Uncharacterized protein n=1 Tax=Musa acuminata subsp. malaccensis TaxID=214687 RepID=A0A804INZ7_MUSAM
MLTSSNRSTRCHQASIFSHSTSSVEKLLFLSVHPPRGETLEDITTVEGYTDIIVLKHFKSGVARWQLLQPVFFFIKAGMIKDSIQHSTLLHQKTFLKVALCFLEVASRSDVAYQARAQKERFGEMMHRPL